MAGSYVFKRRGEVYPKGSGKASGKFIAFHRHGVGRCQFSFDTIGKSCRVISGSCFLAGLFNMQFLWRSYRTNAQVSSSAATSHSGEAVDRDTGDFRHCIIITGMATRIIIRTHTNHSERSGSARSYLSVITGSTDKQVDILCILCNWRCHDR